MKQDKTRKKSWMTDGILQLMEKRRKVKNKEKEYRTVNKIIKKGSEKLKNKR